MQQLMRHCLPSSQQLLHFWDWGRQSTLSPCAPPGSGDSLPRLKMMLILCERPPKTILHQTSKIDGKRVNAAHPLTLPKHVGTIEEGGVLMH